MIGRNMARPQNNLGFDDNVHVSKIIEIKRARRMRFLQDYYF